MIKFQNVTTSLHLLLGRRVAVARGNVFDGVISQSVPRRLAAHPGRVPFIGLQAKRTLVPMRHSCATSYRDLTHLTHTCVLTLPGKNVKQRRCSGQHSHTNTLV